jgi:hypothetical protein
VSSIAATIFIRLSPDRWWAPHPFDAVLRRGTSQVGGPALA